MKICHDCNDLLGAWSNGAQAHSQIIGRLVSMPMDHPGRARLESDADESAERAIGAREVYRQHREEHECADASAFVTDLLSAEDPKPSG